MPRVTLRVLVALALTTSCLEATLSASCPPALAAGSLVGTWAYSPHDSDDLEAAIAAATSRLNIVFRGRATGRLRDTNKPYQRIAITWDPQNTTVKTDTQGAVTAPSSGAPTRWTRADGQVFDVMMVWRSELRLEEYVANAEGGRINDYALRPGGRAMDMRVFVTSGRPPLPLRYRLSFAAAWEALGLPSSRLPEPLTYRLGYRRTQPR